MLAFYASQYGNPYDYPLILRAKLVTTFGITARLLDRVQQAVLAPYTKGSKPPEAVLPEYKGNKKSDVPRKGYDKEQIDRLLHIDRK